jgi:NADPH-dependent ferric siderophore reductase
MNPEAMLGRYPGAMRLSLQVGAVTDPTQRMREIRLGGSDLAGLEPLPGQDLMLAIATEGERTVYRRYTIRRYDPASATVDLALFRHGQGPGSAWVEAVEPGDHVEAIGPRGKITLASDVTRHLFIGDESAQPMAFAMTEALPPGSLAELVLEVEGRSEEQRLEPVDGAQARVMWVHRGEARPGGSERLAARASSVELPDGPWQAYVAGELRVVNAVRSALAGRGFGPERISAKAYWGLGRSNADRGEPIRD